MSVSLQLRPQLVAREPEISFDEYPRIAPGEYYALCTSSKVYRDGMFDRWEVCVSWNMLPSNSCFEPIARNVPMFFSLGEKSQPHAERRSKYFSAWIHANGGPPCSRDRLSPKIFKGRVARVQVADTNSAVPYSVVRKILNFETGVTLSFRSGSQSYIRFGKG